MTTVKRKRVKNVDAFAKLVEKAKGSGSILLLVQRGADSQFVAITPR